MQLKITKDLLPSHQHEEEWEEKSQIWGLKKADSGMLFFKRKCLEFNVKFPEISLSRN